MTTPSTSTTVSDDPFPAGIPPRRRRPRITADPQALAVALGLGLLGAALLQPSISVAALTGALAGTVLKKLRPPMPLELAVTNALSTHHLLFSELYRRGPRRVTLLISRGDQFWTIDSEAPPDATLTPDDIDDWIYGDIVDFQLPKLGFGDAS